MVQDALGLLAAVTRHLIVPVAATFTLAAPVGAVAQSAADHAALAHGKPIINGHPVQPTPGVVDERLRHHEEMLRAEQDGSVRPLVAISPGYPTRVPDASGGSVKPRRIA